MSDPVAPGPRHPSRLVFIATAVIASAVGLASGDIRAFALAFFGSIVVSVLAMRSSGAFSDGARSASTICSTSSACCIRDRTVRPSSSTVFATEGVIGTHAVVQIQG